MTPISDAREVLIRQTPDVRCWPDLLFDNAQSNGRWYVDPNDVKLGLVANGPISPERARQIAANPKLAGATSGGASSSASSDSEATTCTSEGGSEAGAAIGALISGEADARLGGMLGGLGRKKKKQGGCSSPSVPSSTLFRTIATRGGTARLRVCAAMLRTPALFPEG